MIFIDALALIAMMAGEDDADALADLMAAERVRLCSPIVLWETTTGICRSYGFTAAAARGKVRDFLAAHGIEIVSIGEREYEFTAQAHADFGKGRHPLASTWAIASPIQRQDPSRGLAVQGRGLPQDGYPSRGSYLPLNAGFRFSTKAAIPSF